jgi:hypothetical protein
MSYNNVAGQNMIQPENSLDIVRKILALVDCQIRDLQKKRKSLLKRLKQLEEEAVEDEHEYSWETNFWRDEF